MSEIKTEGELAELLQIEFDEGQAINPKHLNLREEVLFLNRVSKVVKGGRRFSFAALVAVGDENGHVGLGFGKANEVPDAIHKGVDRAKKNLIRVPLMGRTIPHQVIGCHDSARVLLKPASEGTGLIAGAAVRAYLSLAGVHDILAKSLGSGNILNVIKATYMGLISLKRADEIAQLRGKKIEDLIGVRGSEIFTKSKVAILVAENPELVKQHRERKEAAAAAEAVQAAKRLEESKRPQPELADDVPAESDPVSPPAVPPPAVQPAVVPPPAAQPAAVQPPVVPPPAVAPSPVSPLAEEPPAEEPPVVPPPPAAPTAPPTPPVSEA